MIDSPATAGKKSPDPEDLHDKDASTIKDWVVSSSGFWYLGSASVGEYMAEFRGTWYQVRRRVRELRELEARHAKEKNDMYWRQQREYSELLKSPATIVRA